MRAERLVPILNVSDLQQSFEWFEKLGWTKGWEWGSPPDFGGVSSGNAEIFLCLNGQGGRGETAAWMSIWVADVDAVHRHCSEQGLDVIWPPTNMPWGVREMHVRHPDGHVLRIGQNSEGEE
jgi:catechol 2,3-dioxygenase-like lactoylglutathione lyase family enzyme